MAQALPKAGNGRIGDESSPMWAGVMAGLIAGVAMALYLMIDAAVAGVGAWLPLRLVAGSFQGVRALISGPGTILVGLLLHLLISALFGGIFAVLLGNRNPGVITIVYGWAYAMAILLLMTFIVLPRIDMTMASRVRVIPIEWLMAHLVFGTAVALTPLVHLRRPRLRSRMPA